MIELALQPFEGVLVHPLRPSADEVEDAWLPTKPLPNGLRSPHVVLSLTLFRQLFQE
jgi:hypothetical protein